MPCEAKCGQALRGLPRLTKTETCKIETCARRSVPLAQRAWARCHRGYPTPGDPRERVRGAGGAAGTLNWIACRPLPASLMAAANA